MGVHVSCISAEFCKGYHPFLCIGMCAYQCTCKSFKPFWFSQGLKFKREIQENSPRAGASNALPCHHRARDAQCPFPALSAQIAPVPGGDGSSLNWVHTICYKGVSFFSVSQSFVDTKGDRKQCSSFLSSRVTFYHKLSSKKKWDKQAK